MTLSGNQIDERSENGTIIGYLNTTAPTSINNSYYGNKKHEYQLVKERCNSYPFVVLDNELRLKFYDTRRARPNSQGEIPNYVIIQVKTNTNDRTRFMILIKSKENYQLKDLNSHCTTSLLFTLIRFSLLFYVVLSCLPLLLLPY